MSGMPWFRFYSEALGDRKLVRVGQSSGLGRLTVMGAWAVLLALANESPERGCLMIAQGEPLTDDEIRAEMELAEGDYGRLMEGFRSMGMVHRGEGERWVISNWEKRNFESDNATARSRRWRKEKQAVAPGASAGVKQVEGGEDRGAAALSEAPDATLQERSVRRGCNGPDTDTDTEPETDAETETDPETETETDTDHAYADAGASRGEAPRTFQGWHERVTRSKNPNGILREMVETLFPGRSPPSYQYIGRTAQLVGGAGRLADLVWQAAARPPTGDLLRYCQGMAKGGNGRTREPADPAAVREHVRRYLGEDDGE